MPAVSYQYYKPSEPYTIDQFVACQSDTVMSYYNLSFVDSVEYKFMNEEIHYSTYNAISDYIDEVRESCLKVSLSDDEMLRYKYRPKLLCYDIYGNGELAFIVLIINDMYSVKQFTKNNIMLPNRNTMNQICKELFNTNKSAIEKYNDNNNLY